MEYSELYCELEKHLRPTIRSMARKFAPALHIEVDDAEQEARSALFLAFQRYDYNRSHGGVQRFARTAIHNAFCGLLYKATTQTRAPHTVYEEDGKLVATRQSILSLEDLDRAAPDDSLNPEDEAEANEAHAAIRKLWMRLYNECSAEERLVLEAIYRPSDKFNTFLRNLGETEASYQLIGRYLGITKNVVDWRVHKIKRHFVKLAESPEFSPLFEEAIASERWPMLHHTKRADDHEFVSNFIGQRQLDPRPLSRDVSKVQGASSIVERYSWGAVLYLGFEGEHRTIVVRGRFNERSGEVFGESGGWWKSVAEVVPWYKRLNHVLRREAEVADESKTPFPVCMGNFEKGDRVCNGDPKGPEEDQLPCVFRDRCSAFKIMLGEKDQEPRKWLKPKEVETENGPEEYAFCRVDETKFLNVLDGYVEKFQIKSGRVTQRQVRKPAAKKAKGKKAAAKASAAAAKAGSSRGARAKKAATKGKAVKDGERVENVKELGRWLVSQLSTTLGAEVADGRGSATPGQLYIVDRTEKSGYFSVYRADGAKRIGLLVAFYKARQGVLDVGLAVPWDEWPKLVRKSDAAKIVAKDMTGKDGVFQTRLLKLDRERLSIVVEALLAAQKRGIVRTPEVSG